MPKISPPASPIEKILPRIKKLLAKGSFSSEDQELFLSAIRDTPERVLATLEASLKRERKKKDQPILDKLQNPTPYMTVLKTAFNSSSDNIFKRKVTSLVNFELLDDKTPLTAWEVMILSTELGIPPPPWAGESFRQILDGYITGTICDLAIAFGLKGTRGKDSEYYKRQLEARNHALCLEIRFNFLRGTTIKKACALVAQQIGKQRRTGEVNDTIYPLIPPNFRDKAFATTLAKKIYPKWLQQQVTDCLLDQIDRQLSDQLRHDP
jgi:hypothetical protein